MILEQSVIGEILGPHGHCLEVFPVFWEVQAASGRAQLPQCLGSGNPGRQNTLKPGDVGDGGR